MALEIQLLILQTGRGIWSPGMLAEAYEEKWLKARSWEYLSAKGCHTWVWGPKRITLAWQSVCWGSQAYPAVFVQGGTCLAGADQLAQPSSSGSASLPAGRQGHQDATYFLFPFLSGHHNSRDHTESQWDSGSWAHRCHWMVAPLAQHHCRAEMSYSAHQLLPMFLVVSHPKCLNRKR